MAGCRMARCRHGVDQATPAPCEELGFQADARQSTAAPSAADSITACVRRADCNRRDRYNYNHV